MRSFFLYIFLLLGGTMFNMAAAENNLSLRQVHTFKQKGDSALLEKDYYHAIPMYEQAVSSYKRFGKYMDFLICAEKLSVCYENLGKFREAISIKEEIMTIHSLIISDNDETYAIHLSNLAHLYSENGDYNKAISIANEAMNLKKYIYGDESEEYSSALNNIAFYYSCLGNYEEATSYMSKAADIIEKNQGKESKEYAAFYNYMASISYRLGRYHDALFLQTKCANILEKYQDSDDYYVSLQNLALYKYNADNNNLDTAIVLTEQALDIQKSRKKDLTSFYGIGLCNLTSFYIKKSQFNKAERCGLEAMNVYKSIYGDSHPNITTLMVNLSALYFHSNQTAKAIEFISNTTEAYYLQTLNAFKSLTKKERLYYWLRYEPWCMYGLPYYTIVLKEKELIACNYNALLFSKGLLLNSEREITEIIQESGDKSLYNDYLMMQQYNAEINYLSQHYEKSLSATIDSIKKLADEKEKELMSKSFAYGDFTRSLNIHWDSVRNALSSNQVAIEYMNAPLNEDSTIYCALLLRDTCSYPIMIPLFEEKEVASLINTVADSATNFTYSYDNRGQILSHNVWSKILPYIKKGETIYFAPSGLLHQLAIESLPYDEDYTMADMFNLVRLSSTREIVMNKNRERHTTAALYGGIKYDVDVDNLVLESEKYPEVVKRSVDLDTTNRGTIDYLKGTKAEVENINSMLKQNNLQVQLFTSTNANEESFKALSGKHRNILHIATHGFFWTDSTAQKKEYFSQRMLTLDNNMPSPLAIDPLNRCGLLFAGAQIAWSGHSSELPEGVQDGILTAKEISLLDLRDADLVVLSACETGKGDITGDGVFGLQRAFKQAGAQTIIMSLWPVNDAATQLLMTEFYRNWITNHQTKREAFRNAQNYVRKKYEEPVYWAGFIMLD